MLTMVIGYHKFDKAILILILFYNKISFEKYANRPFPLQIVLSLNLNITFQLR